MKLTKNNSKSYLWGENCKGWHLLNTPSLSVIQEIMPPCTKEVLHKHNKAQQLFYVLKGTATFEIDATEVRVSENESIHIKKGKTHKILNKTNADLEFLVISEPHAHGDRVTDVIQNEV